MRRGEGRGQIEAVTTSSSPLEHVEAPVHSVEEDEGEGEHHPRILVDDVHVLDGGDGALDGRGALLDGGDDPLPVRGAGCVNAGAGGEGIVTVDAE